ncbi:MAG: hypothetical protein FD123_4261 [Bacteroidetes bacterium]|nr:MAG: hypothetical protein FD123_4261 [Bacteroidota bacterium]
MPVPYLCDTVIKVYPCLAQLSAVNKSIVVG